MDSGVCVRWEGDLGVRFLMSVTTMSVVLGMRDLGGLDVGDESVAFVRVVDGALSTVGLLELVDSLDVVTVSALFLAVNILGVGVVDGVFELVFDWLRRVGGLLVVAVTSVGLLLVAVLGSTAHGGDEGQRYCYDLLAKKFPA